jgi:4-diphosphocytidyl-2-C-methyl-D-erythritol kinase
MHNALETPALELNPDVACVLRELRRSDILAAQMTGSGSACFAVCRSYAQAQYVGERLRQQAWGQVFVVPGAR